MERIFTAIYEQKVWGDNAHQEYRGSSGGGSSIEYNRDAYIPFLQKFIKERNIKTVVDLGCGDFRCGTQIYTPLDVQYHGYDVYQPMVASNSKMFLPPKYRFTTMDFYAQRATIETADLCILKDVLQHWSKTHIETFLCDVVQSKKFRYIVITNCCRNAKEGVDIVDGAGRPLSSQQLPLRQFKPVTLLKYHTKEVCMIQC